MRRRKGTSRAEEANAIRREQRKAAHAAMSSEAGIEFSLELMSWPAIDTRDANAVMERFSNYLHLCEKYRTKPLISGACMALGFTRTEVIDWANGKRNVVSERTSANSARAIMKVMQVLEVNWEHEFAGGGYKQPVTGIFLGKNNFGYKDQSETLISHQKIESAPSRAELEAKYAATIPQEIPAEDVVVEKVVPDRPPRKKHNRVKKRELPGKADN